MDYGYVVVMMVEKRTGEMCLTADETNTNKLTVIMPMILQLLAAPLHKSKASKIFHQLLNEQMSEWMNEWFSMVVTIIGSDDGDDDDDEHDMYYVGLLFFFLV